MMKRVIILLSLLAFCVQAEDDEAKQQRVKRKRAKAELNKAFAEPKARAPEVVEVEPYDFERPTAVANARKALLLERITAAMEGRTVVSLDELLKEALEKSTALKTAQLSLHNMVENVERAGYRYNPDFTIEVAPAHTDLLDATDEDDEYTELGVGAEAALRQHLRGNIDITGSAEYQYSDRLRDVQTYSLSISKELFRPDTIRHSLTLADLKLELEKVSREQTSRNFVYEVKAAYYDYLQQWLVYLNSLAKFEDDAKLNKESERKFAAGIIAQYQLLDYERDFTDSEMSLENDKLKWKTARNRLLFLMQRPLDSPIEFRPYSDAAPPERDWQTKDMLDVAMRTSLSVANLNESLLSNEENLDYYRKRLRPSVSLSGGIEYERVDPMDGAHVEETLGVVGLRIVLPLFQTRFADQSRVRTQQNELEISKLELEQRFRFYQLTVANDLLALRNQRKHYELANKKFRIAFVDYELGKLRFANGTIGSYDMIRNKNHFFGSNARSISLQYQLLKTEARLERDYPVPVEAELDDKE
jgi:outer membrane protein TolC